MARLDRVNARIGARRSRLLGAAKLRELLAVSTDEARLEWLERSARGPDLPERVTVSADALGAVETALRTALAREAAWLLSEIEGARPRALLAAFLGLSEAEAVKAILRGVAAGARAGDLSARVPPTPALSPEALAALAAAPSPEALADALRARGSSLAEPLLAALETRAARGLLPAEIAIDRAAAARALAACEAGGEDAEVLAAHVADRVDARNAATLLAIGGTGGGDAPFVPGGRRIGREAFARLASAPAAALREGIAAAFPGTAADLALPWAADRALERALLARLRPAARSRPLSIAVPLAYLAERTAEVRRIAIVLRGAALGLPGDEILDLASLGAAAAGRLEGGG